MFVLQGLVLNLQQILVSLQKLFFDKAVMKYKKDPMIIPLGRLARFYLMGREWLGCRLRSTKKVFENCSYVIWLQQCECPLLLRLQLNYVKISKVLCCNLKGNWLGPLRHLPSCPTGLSWAIGQSGIGR